MVCGSVPSGLTADIRIVSSLPDSSPRIFLRPTWSKSAAISAEVTAGDQHLRRSDLLARTLPESGLRQVLSAEAPSDFGTPDETGEIEAQSVPDGEKPKNGVRTINKLKLL
jgi:hypothetical protein